MPHSGLPEKYFLLDYECDGKHDRGGKKEKKQVLIYRSDEEEHSHQHCLSFVEEGLFTAEGFIDFHIHPAIIFKIDENAASPAPAPRIFKASLQMF